MADLRTRLMRKVEKEEIAKISSAKACANLTSTIERLKSSK
jgi:hypothetical protein